MPEHTITKPEVSSAIGIGLQNDMGSGVTTISNVTNGGLAFRAGLEVGAIVHEINGVSVTGSTQGTALLKEAVGEFTVRTSPPSAVATPALTEQHIVAFTRTPGECGELDAKMSPPPFDSWFEARGIAQSDFDTMMSRVIAPINEYQGRAPTYICVTLVSCGAAGWCCQLAEAGAIPGTIQLALDAFNAKYPSVKGAMSQAPPGLVFSGVPLAAPSLVVAPSLAVAPVVAAQVMEREDPLEAMRKLKTMLDEGLITQAEHDNKKAEILSGM